MGFFVCILLMSIVCSEFVQSQQQNVVVMQQAQHDWDYMIFTQMWPETSCIADAGEHDCKVSKNVTSWIIHGIWPTKNGTYGPVYCNNTMKFDEDKIKTIEGDLTVTWPNLFKNTPFINFWKHEYEKHGTCAATLPSLDSELKYFSKGLELSSNFSTEKMLAAHGLRPEAHKTHTYEEFKAAFEEVFSKRVAIQCAYDKHTATQYIMQLEICLNKQYQVIDCQHKDASLQEAYWDQMRFSAGPSSAAMLGPINCTHKIPISYPPITHKMHR